MIISEQWLRSWVSPEIDTEALAHQLTMAGLEVDAITPVAGEFSGVVVAEIISAEQHPDADKLRVCQVETGEGQVQIVCGAPNARVGLKAPLAKVGARLPGDFKIKKAKLRGVESQGMLCAQAELGISEENAGLMELADDAPVGTDLRDYLHLDDRTLELGLTPNRADCLSVAGVARDVGAITGVSVVASESVTVAVATDKVFPVVVEATEKCPRYVGRVISGVDLTRATPLAMAERLRRAGLRCIDPVVDVTNYVMLELGQPLHAFDLDKLEGGIVVRDAKPAEQMTLLDGSEITLEEGSLVIADHNRALALAGIMGGENSGVSANTQNVFLESAFFTPELIAGRARRYGLHTDASHRYERGVDWQLQQQAIERATELLCQIVGGEAGPLVEVSSDAALPERAQIELRASRIRRILGFDFPADQVATILSALGFEVTSVNDGLWRCVAPSWRFDMSQEDDLIEELARIYGYDNLPATRIAAPLAMVASTEGKRGLGTVRRQLVARGFHEAITFSFVAPELQAMFRDSESAIALRNPISADLSEMRTSLLPGLANALAHNIKRQTARLRLFETGGTFFLEGEAYQQRQRLGLAMLGARDSENWTGDAERIDFYDIKGEVEQILAGAGIDATFAATTHPGLHPGQTAEVRTGEQRIAVLGALHPTVAKALDLPASTYLAELDLAGVLSAPVPAYQDISRYPESRRDIAVVLNDSVSAEQVLAQVRRVAGSALVDLCVFDVYAGKGVEPGHKSLALGLTFRDQTRTLDDSEISDVIAQVVDSLTENLGAQLRS